MRYINYLQLLIYSVVPNIYDTYIFYPFLSIIDKDGYFFMEFSITLSLLWIVILYGAIVDISDNYTNYMRTVYASIILSYAVILYQITLYINIDRILNSGAIEYPSIRLVFSLYGLNLVLVINIISHLLKR